MSAIVPNIFIDTSGLSREFQLSKDDIDNLAEAVVKTVTKVVHTAWRNQAKQNLRSTREQYMNSIFVSDEGRFTNVLTLVGMLPNMLESGMSAFDMKRGFEMSNKKVITRNKDGALGWYLTIPFTWAQPGSLGESQKFTGVLPSDVAKVLNKKQSVQPGSSLSLSDIPEEFRIPQKRSEVSLLNDQIMPEYTNKSSLFEGLTKVTEKGSSQVMSFRRVSNNSDDNSWIHTGIKAYNLAEKAVEDAKIPEVVGDVIDAFLDQL